MTGFLEPILERFLEAIDPAERESFRSWAISGKLMPSEVRHEILRKFKKVVLDSTGRDEIYVEMERISGGLVFDAGDAALMAIDEIANTFRNCA
jgi:hypothetical protein